MKYGFACLVVFGLGGYIALQRGNSAQPHLVELEREHTALTEKLQAVRLELVDAMLQLETLEIKNRK